jgi:IS5 family transposase
MRPGKQTQLVKGSAEAEAEKEKAGIRAKVEHAFFYIKRMFGCHKVCYRRLEKNTNRLYLLAGFANLLRGGTPYGDLTRIDPSETCREAGIRRKYE